MKIDWKTEKKKRKTFLTEKHKSSLVKEYVKKALLRKINLAQLTGGKGKQKSRQDKESTVYNQYTSNVRAQARLHIQTQETWITRSAGRQNHDYSFIEVVEINVR